jgi:protocatechuate 3,4-dioxygenase beta subunit
MTRHARAVCPLAACALLAGSVIFAAGLAGPTAISTAASVPKCPITPNGYMDPNYTPNPPVRSQIGRGFILTGVVRSGIDCKPLGHVRVEIWHAGPNGSYDMIHRATVITDAAGRFRLETDFPGSSFGRPHIHVRVAVTGFKTTATVFFPAPGTHTGTMDIVLEPEV